MKLLCTSTIFFGCGEDKVCLIGSGTVNQYELSLPDFDRISLIGPTNLSVSQGDVFSVVVMAESAMFQELDYQVKNEVLEIGFKDNIRCFDTEHGVWVKVTLPNLKRIDVSGSSKINCTNNLMLDQLTIDVAGVADVSLDGEVNKQIISSSGSIKLNNKNFQSKITEVVMEGSGDLQISCSEQLKLAIEGSAKITYFGTPQITQEVKGVLDLIQGN